MKVQVMRKQIAWHSQENHVEEKGSDAVAADGQLELISLPFRFNQRPMCLCARFCSTPLTMN